MGYLSIDEHDIPAVPENVGPHDRTWITRELKALLFGPVDGQQSRTYFIVDPTLRTNITGSFDLQPFDIDLPVKCLFKGNAAEELKEVAPYLIDMTLPAGGYDDPDVASPFYRDFFANHWKAGTGIFVRSTHPIEAVLAHFRRITRYVGENGRGYIFRFWESNSVYDYLGALRQDAYKTRNVFMSRTVLIDGIVCYGRITGRLHVFRPDFDGLRRDAPELAPFVVEDSDHRALMRSLLRPLAIEVSERAHLGKAAGLNNQTPRETENYVLNAIQRMHGIGFTNKECLETLALAELSHGPGFETKQGREQTYAALTGAASEQERVNRAMLTLNAGGI